jgi:hypothetical protein
LRLNGWNRLYVVFAVLLGCAFGLTAFVLTDSDFESESIDNYLAKQADDVVSVQIDSVGTVKFPSSLSKDEIAKLVRSGMTERPHTVQAIANGALRDRASRAAFEAFERNSERSRQNRKLYLTTAGAWVLVCLLVYGVGWSVAWVRRGFKDA